MPFRAGRTGHRRLYMCITQLCRSSFEVYYYPPAHSRVIKIDKPVPGRRLLREKLGITRDNQRAYIGLTLLPRVNRCNCPGVTFISLTPTCSLRDRASSPIDHPPVSFILFRARVVQSRLAPTSITTYTYVQPCIVDQINMRVKSQNYCNVITNFKKKKEKYHKTHRYVCEVLNYF